MDAKKREGGERRKDEEGERVRGCREGKRTRCHCHIGTFSHFQP